MTRRRLLAAAYAGFLVSGAYLVWSPERGEVGRAIHDVAALLQGAGLPLGTVAAEFALNVVMFVPVSLLGAFLFQRWGMYDWFLIGLAAALIIEMVQGTLLPTRTSSSLDVIANVIGSVTGLCGAVLVREVARRCRADKMVA